MTNLTSLSPVIPFASWTAVSGWDGPLQSLNVCESAPPTLQNLGDLPEINALAKPLSLTPKRARKELLAAILPSYKIVLSDLRAYPRVSLALFLGVGIAATIQPFPHFDKAIMALGAGTALWMIAGGLRLSAQALAEQSEARLQNAKAEFGVGALSLLIMAGTFAGLAGLENTGFLAALPRDGDANAAVKAISSLLHFGDEIVAGIAIVKRLNAKLASTHGVD